MPHTDLGMVGSWMLYQLVCNVDRLAPGSMYMHDPRFSIFMVDGSTGGRPCLITLVRTRIGYLTVNTRIHPSNLGPLLKESIAILNGGGPPTRRHDSTNSDVQRRTGSRGPGAGNVVSLAWAMAAASASIYLYNNGEFSFAHNKRGCCVPCDLD